MRANIDDARLLHALATHASITDAARALGITQQAASARLAGIERWVGAPVAARGAGGTRLTSVGRLVAGWATELVEAADRLDQSVAMIATERAAKLDVASSLTILEELMPYWLLRLREADDQLQVGMTASNSTAVIEAVRAGHAALGFTECPSRPRGVETRVIAHDEVIVVVPPEHPWARRRSGVGLAELATTPLVVREPGSGTRAAIDRALRPLGGVTIAAELPSSAPLRATVAAGGAPGVLSVLAARDDLRSGRLVRVAIAERRIVRPLTAIWQRGTALPPAARALVDIASSTVVRGVPDAARRSVGGA